MGSVNRLSAGCLPIFEDQFKVRLRWFGADLVKLQYLSFIMGFEHAIYQMEAYFLL